MPEERIERHERAGGQREKEPGIERRDDRGPKDEHEQVRHQNHREHGTEDDRIDGPGAAEEQSHLHDRLGLDQHEAGAEKEHLRQEATAVSAGRDGPAPARTPQNGNQEERARNAHDEHAPQAQRRDHRPAQIEKRPRVARQPKRRRPAGRPWSG